ncbi:MAG: GNAT family N-acetyltransferase [Asgard group archaeon]|nr:GNAT family N-acetyltransferase [Asgard group archaeon]
MTIKFRDFNWNNDFLLVRDFLIQTYSMTKSFENWIPQKFENRKFGPGGTVYQDEEDDLVKIWVDESFDDKKIVAVTVLNSSGANWINIHPNYSHLEKQLIEWIEKQIINKEEFSNFYVLETNQKRIDIIQELGYKNLGCIEYTRTRPLDFSIVEVNLPEKYSIRNINPSNDFLKYKQVISAVFPHCSNMTQEIFNIYTTASFFNEDLDLVVVAPDGNFAAFCTVRLDPISKIAEFEPVGTHPNHRKLGLGKAVMLEGLKRLQKYQPKAIVIVDAANTEGANRLYDSIGFTDKIAIYHWQKKL